MQFILTNKQKRKTINHYSPFFIYPCSVIDELNTEHDVLHAALHPGSMQVDGVPGLKLLVHSPPNRGPHLASAVGGVVGVGSCLTNFLWILMNMNISKLIGVIAAHITECYQVYPGKGGSEHSWNKGNIDKPFKIS